MKTVRKEINHKHLFSNLGIVEIHHGESLAAILDKHLLTPESEIIVILENVEALGDIDWKKYTSLHNKKIFINDKVYCDLLNSRGFNARRYYPASDVVSIMRFLVKPKLRTKSIEKHFTRLSNSTHDHSYLIHKFMTENKMLKDSIWSFQYNLENPHRHRFLDNHNYENLEEAVLWGSTWTEYLNIKELNYYFDSAFIINNETVFHGHGPTYSEKLIKCVGCCRPFIEVSAPGTLKDLHSMGIKTFPDLIDESYDDIQDPYRRLEHIKREIKRLHQTPLKDLKRYIKDNEEKLFHNFKVARHLYKQAKKKNYQLFLFDK